MTSHKAEIDAHERFQFGENWRLFLDSVDDSRIVESQSSLLAMLGADELNGLEFIDVGSGSGLSSLAARRAGARVTSFDYDPLSVASTREVKRRFADADRDWIISEGSVLDRQFLASLGTFDVVYSWGVLHHTGDMWTALGNIVPLVRPGGALFIAIYNDQGIVSRAWLHIKKVYCSSPRLVQWFLLIAVATYFTVKSSLGRLARGDNPMPWLAWTRRQSGNRGMAWWRDMVDWVGGYPFEVAKPEAILNFYRQSGFDLQGLKTCGGKLGCNEYVFRRVRHSDGRHPVSSTCRNTA